MKEQPLSPDQATLRLHGWMPVRWRSPLTGREYSERDALALCTIKSNAKRLRGKERGG